MDRILIKDLLVRCILGVNEDERHHEQDVVINLVLWADLRPAAASDRLEDTVDYRSLKKRVMALAQESRCYLIEALAGRIAALCLQTEGVRRVRVRVEKPTALRFARSVGVQITRSRS